MPTETIRLKGYRCNACGWHWLPREQGKVPAVCPKCKSYRWDQPKPKKK